MNRSYGHLNDEGVQDCVFHAADVQVEDLKRKPLQDGDYLQYLPWYLPCDHFEDHIRPGDPRFDVRNPRAAACSSCELLISGTLEAEGTIWWRSDHQLKWARAWAGARTEALPPLLGLEGLKDLVQLLDELYNSPNYRCLISLQAS